MHARFVLLTSLLISLSACASFPWLNKHGRDLADTVLACVPEASKPTPEDAARCLDAARERLESSSAAEPTDGETVLRCAEELRRGEQGDAYAQTVARRLLGELQ